MKIARQVALSLSLAGLSACGQSGSEAPRINANALLPQDAKLDAAVTADFAGVLSTMGPALHDAAQQGCGPTEGALALADVVKTIWGCVLFSGWSNIHLGTTNTNVVHQGADLVGKQHPELTVGGTGAQWSWDGGGHVTLWYNISSGDMAMVKAAANAAYQEAQKINGQTSNLVTRARMAHDYIATRTRYDYFNYEHGTIPAVSYSAYGPLVLGVAVCEGYTAAFNLMAFYTGISSTGVVGSGNSVWKKNNHAWNKVIINGSTSFIDVTFDDPVNPATGTTGPMQLNYFMISAQKLAQDHAWNDADSAPVYFDGVHI